MARLGKSSYKPQPLASDESMNQENIPSGPGLMDSSVDENDKRIEALLASDGEKYGSNEIEYWYNRIDRTIEQFSTDDQVKKTLIEKLKQSPALRNDPARRRTLLEDGQVRSARHSSVLFTDTKRN